MEGERFRKSVPAQRNPTSRFFTNSVMAILDFKLATLQLPLGCTLNCRTLLGSNKKIYGA
jgi:hypothetical protein